MKSESGTLVKAISILFAAFILFSSFPLQVSAENEMTPGIALEKDLTLNTPHTLVGGSSSSTSLQPMVTETGKINVSVDGLGTSGSGIIQVEKPSSGSTVRDAYLLATGVWSSTVPNGSVLIDGNAVYWDTSVDATCHNYWTDVTSLIKPKIDAEPAGRINFTITELNPGYTDGSVLVVIFDDPSQKVDNTVILAFGAQDPAGDTFEIKLAEPLDKSNPDLVIDMGLGISFSYQANGGGQVSQVDVNGERVTSSAGGEDDGNIFGDGLLTVGGLDDSNENPSDPLAGPSNSRTDDELYNLLPFVDNGATNITVYTYNPSTDDNIFFSYVFLKSTTAMVGEGILLSPVSGNVSVGSQYTLASMAQDDDGNPLEGKEVHFVVVSGSNAGQSGSATTDAAGRANFSYFGTFTGTDLIEASFVNTAGETFTSNQASVEWTAPLLLPVANFDSNVTLGIQPFTVSFYDRSENAASWSWDFGDGNSSELQNCTHTYFEPGYYTVSLTVNNSEGSSNTSVREDYIFVQALPIPAFSANITEGTFPLTVQFTDESQYAESVEWNFGDGSSSTTLNPVHTYSEAGLYSVSLAATGNGTSVTKTVEDCINVTIPPVPDFSANVTEGTFPLTVQFTDESQYAESVEWNFGDGNSSTTLNPVHTYSEAGLYSVSLVATGNGTSVTKTVEDCINVTIPPIPSFSANVTEGTFPLSVQFTDESQYAESVEWNFGDGSSSTGLNPVHTYSEAGLYTVSLTATGNGTSVTKTVEDCINVTIPPVPDFSANVTEGTFPLSVQFTDESQYAESVEWNFGDGSSSTGLNPVHTYSEAGLYTVSLTATGNGTSVTKTIDSYINVTIPPVPAFSANITEGLFPLTVKFTDESQYAETLEWNFGDGDSSNELNPIHTYSAAGLYSVSLTATGNGTSVTKTVENYLNVTLLPIPDFGANVTTGPYPLTVQFMDNSSYAESVEWNFGDGSGSNERNPVHTYEERGLYNVTLDASGNGTTVNKTVEDFINVTIQPFPPAANFSASLIRGPAPLTVSFTDESYNAVSWEWDFEGDGQVDYTGKNPVHTYETPGSYDVTLYVSNAYGNDTKVVEDCINVLAHPVISERNLSKTSVYPGEEFTVNLSVETAWDLKNLAVVEDIPEGWTLIPIDNAGAEFDSSSNKWVWENCSAGESRQLIYTLKAPLDSDFGIFEIKGNVSAEDLVSISVEGENEVTVTPIADYNPKALKLLHVGDPDQEFNISTHMLCNFTWYVNGKESSEGNAENNAYASLVLSPEALWKNGDFKNNYTSVENSSLFAGKYAVTTRVSNGSAAINHTWNFIITDSAESKENINNTVVLPVREVQRNESVTFDFTEDPDNTDDNSILGVSFNASSAGNVSIFVEVLNDRASEVSENPEGDVYQHMNIHLSNHTVMNETGSDSKFIDFRVSRSWMEKVVPGTVRLNRYHDGEWQLLNTWETGSDAKYYYFRAETPGFSPFSITGENISTPPVSTPHSGGHGTGSATIVPASSAAEDGNVNDAGNEDTDSALSGESDDSGENSASGSRELDVDKEGQNTTELDQEGVSGQETGHKISFSISILLLLLIIGAYLVYRQTKEKK
ncbi:PKD domain-containing protein [Methanosarcina sp. 2.H.T.1A.8]|uniref:PKD domain-containing protein n=1 Tax=Methanosarcina sp. 2.H.T.1A.8 TaxID=1483598 RepID=UPI00062175A4|nr:PKD domain-containing protein [Methanosarcina sp. 2.H.T.1A.8]KKG26024.1 hypothetical protein EO96_16045 [Methanosarcina sp. 2.H.T.1A.8]